MMEKHMADTPEKFDPNNMANLNELMKKAQAMQQKMKWTQAELASMQVTGIAGGDLIQVTMNGKHEVIKVLINDTVLKEKKEILQDLIAVAVNDAARKVEKVTQEKMLKLAKELGLPETPPAE
jgi:nucleoid-associated protein EbfC